MAAVREHGMPAVADATPDRWFTKAGQQRLRDQVAHLRKVVLYPPVKGFYASSMAIRDMDP